MNEKQWEKYLCKLINDELFSDDNFQALSAKELPYLSQIRSYKDSKDEYGCNPKDRKQQTYQTDLLIREINDDSWTPRVVIELKVDSVHTHDALIYGKKSSKHKDIHPYLRYGMAIGGHKKKGIPARLIVNSENFDFLTVFKSYRLSDDEKKRLFRLINIEIQSSKELENLVYINRGNSKRDIHTFHKSLIIEDENN